MQAIKMKDYKHATEPGNASKDKMLYDGNVYIVAYHHANYMTANMTLGALAVHHLGMPYNTWVCLATLTMMQKVQPIMRTPLICCICRLAAKTP